MRFIFYSPVAFEKWDWRNSTEKGIGGSETSHVELSWRLAARGHEVITYAPIPDDCPGEWRGTVWRKLEDVDKNLSGIWLVYRAPQFMDEFPKSTQQKVYLICQDFDYPLTATQLAKIDKVVPLCKAHARHIIQNHPDLRELRSKIWITSNGTKIDLVEETETQIEKDMDWIAKDLQNDLFQQLGERHTLEELKPVWRNPHRIMHASSPDRGLLPLLKSFKKAKEFCPELELHAFYGFDNIDKLIANGAKHMAKNKEEILKWADQDGVELHGRISQPELYREWFKSGIYCYETNFWETSHISGQEAQCMGAVPVFSPVWGQAENLMHGLAIPGDANNLLTQARFAAELAQMAGNHEWQESIRKPMMEESRFRFDWERMVDHLECEITGEPYPYDFPEQLPADEGLKTYFINQFSIVKPLKPKITVITPSIRPDRLAVVRDCLLSQTFQDFEWLVCMTKEVVYNSVISGMERAKLIEQPPAVAGDIYGLNKAWNALAREAKGDLLVCWCDSTYTTKHALENLWKHFQEDPMRCVSGVGMQTKDNTLVQWVDPRLTDIGGVIDPQLMEFRLASIPAKGWKDAGGQDEEFDKVAAYSDKELCFRMRKLGYRMWLDGNIFYWFESHEAHTIQYPDWEERAQAGFEMLASKVSELETK